MAYNKVIYGGKTLIDLSSATATADKILSGYTAYGKSGAKLTLKGKAYEKMLRNRMGLRSIAWLKRHI